MANVTNFGNIAPGSEPAGKDAYFNKQLLARAKPYQQHRMAAQKAKLPDGESDVMRWRRQNVLPTATVPLTEGVPPAGSTMSVLDQTVTLEQYGDYLTISDKVQYLISSPTMNDNMDLLAQQNGETLDELARTVLEATGSVYNCQYGTNGNTPTELTAKDLRTVVKQLKGASAKMFTPIIRGENRDGTVPVRNAYWGMGHTDLEVDIEELASFLPVAKYPSPKLGRDGEIGSAGNIRILLSPLGSVTSGSPDVYNFFVAGRDAYGDVENDKLTIKHIFNDAKSGGTSNPLWQYSTQGWKAFYAAKILNDSWVINTKATLNV